MRDALEHAEAVRDNEAYLLALALGVIAVGTLVLFYAATPLGVWMSSEQQPVAIAPQTLDSPGLLEAAGAYVALGPLELDFRGAVTRILGRSCCSRWSASSATCGTGEAR